MQSKFCLLLCTFHFAERHWISREFVFISLFKLLMREKEKKELQRVLAQDKYLTVIWHINDISQRKKNERVEKREKVYTLNNKYTNKLITRFDRPFLIE